MHDRSRPTRHLGAWESNLEPLQAGALPPQVICSDRIHAARYCTNRMNRVTTNDSSMRSLRPIPEPPANARRLIGS